MLAEWAGEDRRYRRRSEFSGKAVTGFNPVTAFLLLSVSSPTSAWSESIGEDDSPSLKGLPPICRNLSSDELRKERRVEAPCADNTWQKERNCLLITGARNPTFCWICPTALGCVV